MSRSAGKWIALVLMAAMAVGAIVLFLLRGVSTTSPSATASVTGAVALPAPGQKLLPAVLTAFSPPPVVYNNVVMASSSAVAMVDFTLTTAAYARYQEACEQLKQRDGLRACDNQLQLGDEQCSALMTDQIRQAIASWKPGAVSPKIYCVVRAADSRNSPQ